jgi:hypothetical protein
LPRLECYPPGSTQRKKPTEDALGHAIDLSLSVSVKHVVDIRAIDASDVGPCDRHRDIQSALAMVLGNSTQGREEWLHGEAMRARPSIWTRSRKVLCLEA